MTCKFASLTKQQQATLQELQALNGNSQHFYTQLLTNSSSAVTAQVTASIQQALAGSTANFAKFQRTLQQQQATMQQLQASMTAIIDKQPTINKHLLRIINLLAVIIGLSAVCYLNVGYMLGFGHVFSKLPFFQHMWQALASLVPATGAGHIVGFVFLVLVALLFLTLPWLLLIVVIALIDYVRRH